MDLKKEFNQLIPKEFGGEMNPELLNRCIKVCELSNLKAIQDYLLTRGTNDEDINERIRQLQK